MNSAQRADRRLVVIGVGHRDRGDDGIGPAVVDALSHLADEVTTIVREGDLAVLPLLWEPVDDVVIVDASLAGSEPVGTMQEIELDRLVSSMGMSTHGLNVADAIQLAERLGRSPARLRVIGISGQEFQLGPMSQDLHRQVDTLADRLRVMLGLSCARR